MIFMTSPTNWGVIDKALRDLFAGGVFPGVGDAGAHEGMVMDAGWSTFVHVAEKRRR